MIQHLPVRLTEGELLLKGRELSRLIARIAEAEDAKKEAAKAAADGIKEMECDQAKLARMIVEGAELRPVECEERKNFIKGTVEMFRCDTYELVDTRPMTQTEKQTELFSSPHELKEEEGA